MLVTESVHSRASNSFARDSHLRNCQLANSEQILTELVWNFKNDAVRFEPNAA